MKRRYVQVNGELIEVPLNAQIGEAPNADRVLWGDRQYADLGDPRFSSRTQHRQYLRSRGLTTADDYKGEWARAARARAEFYKNAPDKSRAGDVASAVDEVARGHKPKRVPDEEF
jgi:hypothetical protein